MLVGVDFFLCRSENQRIIWCSRKSHVMCMLSTRAATLRCYVDLLVFTLDYQIYLGPDALFCSLRACI